MAKALTIAAALLLLLTAACADTGPAAQPAQPEAAKPREVQLPRETPTPAPEPTWDAGPPGTTWRGIRVAPEHRCSRYDAKDYPYSPSVEPRIVQAQGGIYGPYTGRWYGSIRETDIEHIVARSEAHDSGLCAASPSVRKRFATDILNLTLASPGVNRHQKSSKDLAEWLPDLNRCWYVGRTLEVRRAYGLTIDKEEADTADRVLNGCGSTGMVMTTQGGPAVPETSAPPGGGDPLAMYDDNGNGRITCSEARAHGIAPVLRGHPAYKFMNDRDGDGVVCE